MAKRRRWTAGALAWVGVALAGVVGPGAGPAAADEDDLKEAEKLLRRGEYAQAAARAQAALLDGAPGLGWRLLAVRALAASGQRKEAVAEVDTLLARHPGSLRGLALAHEVLRRAGQKARAEDVLRRAQEVMAAPGGHLASAEELVAAGEIVLRAGGEPKDVLGTYFGAAVKKDANCREAYLAAGRLALRKHDDALAADWFRRGLKKIGPDADLSAGLGEAFLNGDRKELTKAVDAALHLNARHVGALLLRAEHEIDAEDFTAARRALERALSVDRGEPRAWAFQAVLAHLANDPKAEARAREQALAVVRDNPEVDSLIGRKLSEKYRFVEGAAYQRAALKIDPAHVPAKVQLGQDLLRLGQEKEGWALAEDAHGQDGYDVVAYNLVTLREHLGKLTTLKKGNFIVRVDAREAQIYGDDVLALLAEARGALDTRYGFANPRPVTVEVYPDQADFAVRTFGMPGGAGYLGVCFGNLITMNSPAGNVGTQSNWKAVLWHEYMHVVSLGLSKNKMPRWLSEGISVWEERRRDPAWGQRLTPSYKEMIRQGELVPVGQLSKAFLNPKTGEHLMFAYYESALVVEFLVARYGFEALTAVLRDLGAGVEVNRALEARTAPLKDLEKAFEAFAKSRANESARDSDALVEQAREARKKGAVAEERRALEELVSFAPDQGPAFDRLVELAQAAGDMKALETAARGLAAVNPMTATAWRGLGRALEARAAAEKDRAAAEGATAAYKKLLLLEPPDPADVHLRLARLLRGSNPKVAKRHVLDALAEAPRFREAHRLLMELQRGTP